MAKVEAEAVPFYQSWSLGHNLRDRDIDVAKSRVVSKNSRRNRDLNVPRHETFETKRLQYFADIFDTKFWAFGELPNTLQYRFLGISLLCKKQAI